MQWTGQVITPEDAGYDEAATVYVRTGSPALVARPADAAQVVEAVRHAADSGLVLSVRSGGHSGYGHGTNDGGLVIDLAAMSEVEVLDASRRLVRVGGGAQWGAVATTLAEHGLALTSGDTVSVGVGGLTQGGGIGWMVRNHGLTIDSLVAAEVVTADGRILRVDDSNHPELFWAVRGGAGNVGVVTYFDFVAQPSTDVHAGTITYDVSDVPALLKGWTTALRDSPEEVNATLVLMPGFGPEMPAQAMHLVCYAAADDDAARAALAPLQEIGPVTSSEITRKPYADVLEEAHAPPGVRPVIDNTLVKTATDELISFIADFYGGGAAGRMVFLRAVGGAMSRVPVDATAFAHRDAEVLVVGATFLPEPATDEALAEAIAPFQPVHDFGIGTYVGFVTRVGDDVIDKVYPKPTADRLREVKRTYDPGNLFDQNVNVAP